MTVLAAIFAGIDLADLIGVPLRGAISVSAIVFALGAIGLNLHYGFTGLLNVGMVAFVGAGSYGVAISMTQGWAGGNIIFAMFVGLVMATFIALLVGIPALRLRGDYLAIVTIAIGEVMRVAFRSQKLLDLTGGPFGLPRAQDRAEVSLADTVGRDWNPLFGDGSRSFRLFWLDMLEFDAKTLWLMILGWSTVIILTLLVWRLVESPWGRVVKAIREDEVAARALGKNVFNYKMQSLIIGGLIGAVAGFFRTFDSGFVETLQLRPQTTFFIWTALILGGAASKWGPVLGATLFWFSLLFVEELLRQVVVDNGWLPEWLISSNDIGRIRLIMMGVMLAALMIWRPQGLLGKKEEALLDV